MKISPDTINGLFQLGGAVVELYDVYLLRRDKVVRGIHYSTVAFFMVWAIWSLAYYYMIHQWFSLTGACVLTAASLWWLELLIKYRRR